ncbi:SgcJ/EcaC family oxidoreductase [Spirosoma endbachense]|uniref:SgcJ/EcaC family oxidoreductase n=1 Tax=Spirosoma endbachense TaxID=2666025 RepID=A0A6P1W883_9BACT|nr:SgcJ/EcaC family oxidoreductase [Spirosoma endbachense]QHW00230.1 SgcJ/EcaC family oxidoreductase [Spirosoma endbachense]
MQNSKRALLSLLLCVAVAHIGHAQTDEKAIENQVDKLVSDWNTHSFKNMDTYTTEDVEWVNIVGMWWKGRTEVKSAHQRIFDTIFKGVPFTKKSVKIRSLTPEVAVANLICHVGEFFPPDGVNHGTNRMPEADDLLTLVFVKRNGVWLLSAGQNTVIDSRAANGDSKK